MHELPSVSIQPKETQQPSANTSGNNTPPTPNTGITQRRSSTASSMSRLSASSGSMPTPQKTEPTPSKVLSPDNLVKVRVWTSKTSDGLDTFAINTALGNGNVGHATLETNNIYASIWPDTAVKHHKQEVKAKYVETPERDMALEGAPSATPRPPDFVFEFYSLDAKKIEAKFQQIKMSDRPWTLLGNALNSSGFSCSSLTLWLLLEGGLNNLAGQKIRGFVSPTSNFAISPNNLVNQLLYASKAEEFKHPEVIDYKTANQNKINLKREPIILAVKVDKFRVLNPNEEVLNETYSGSLTKPRGP